ncbi:hypothetical protein Tco_1218280 [Tanacetum coccineum]
MKNELPDIRNESVLMIESNMISEEDELMNTESDLFIYTTNTCESFQILAVDTDLFTYEVVIQETYDEIVHKIREVWASCNPSSEECDGGSSRNNEVRCYWKSKNDNDNTNVEWNDLSLNDWLKIKYGEVDETRKKKILTEHWRKRFRVDYVDSNDFYDPDQCEDSRNNEIRERIIHNLHEEWFKGTSDDENDIEGIIDYLKPIYSLGPGEVYMKLEVSNTEELPRTRNNVATIRSNIMEENPEARRQLSRPAQLIIMRYAVTGSIPINRGLIQAIPISLPPQPIGEATKASNLRRIPPGVQGRSRFIYFLYLIVQIRILGPPRGGIEASQFDELQLLIETVTLSDQVDSWKWSPEVNHGFTIASALLAKWWELDFPLCANMSDWISWLDNSSLSFKVRVILERVGGTLLWSIWSFRNKLVFSSSPPKKAWIWDYVVSQSFMWISSRNSKFKISWLGWLQNPIATITSL